MEQQRAGKKYVRYNKVIEVLLHCTIAEMKNIVPRTYYNYRGLLYRGSTILHPPFMQGYTPTMYPISETLRTVLL